MSHFLCLFSLLAKAKLFLLFSYHHFFLDFWQDDLLFSILFLIFLLLLLQFFFIFYTFIFFNFFIFWLIFNCFLIFVCFIIFWLIFFWCFYCIGLWIVFIDGYFLLLLLCWLTFLFLVDYFYYLTILIRWKVLIFQCKIIENQL